MSREYVYGCNVVETLLVHAPDRIVRLFVDRKRGDQRIGHIRRQIAAHGLACESVDSDKLAALAADGHHQGVVAEVGRSTVLDDRDLFAMLQNRSDPFVCILDNVQDPRNLGACLRTAEAAGVDAVVLSRHDSCGITPVVRHVSAGAAELVPVARVSNLARVLTRLKSEHAIWVVGTSDDADRSLFDIELAGPVALVFGSEGKGLKRLTLDCCDYVGRIPMAGKVGSLNVSVALGIGLFEALRQRRQGAR